MDLTGKKLHLEAFRVRKTIKFATQQSLLLDILETIQKYGFDPSLPETLNVCLRGYLDQEYVPF